MLQFLADEDFNNKILRGLRRRRLDLDIVRVQDIGFSGKTDMEVLEWAAQNYRIVLTHDVSTMAVQAYKRIEQKLPMAGLIEVNQNLSIGQAIEEILLILECSLSEEEWQNQVQYLPL